MARRRWRVALFFAAWTVFGFAVAWWLIRSAGTTPATPELLFDSSQAAQIPVGEQIRRWLKIADLNFRGAYPWVLMAPYIFWLASHFLLERHRLRVSLPVHLLGCILFAAASYALTSRVMEKKKIMVMMTHRTEGPAAPREFLTNQPFV